MTAYVGEIRMFAGNFNPNGWMFCQGQTLPISQYETLFQLIGTTYGGDGEETFNLPNLSGRLPLHQGSGYVIGQMAGVEEVTLTTQQIASHSHPFMATTNIGGASAPGNSVLAQSSTIKV